MTSSCASSDQSRARRAPERSYRHARLPDGQNRCRDRARRECPAACWRPPTRRRRCRRSARRDQPGHRGASADGFGVIGVIDRRRAVGADVHDLMAERAYVARRDPPSKQNPRGPPNHDTHRSSHSGDLLPGRGDNRIRSEAEFLLQFFERRRGPERLHADAVAGQRRHTAPSRTSTPARRKPGP